MLLLAIIVAGGLRFWQLDRLPPGLYRDEAVNGLDALDVLAGQRAGKSPFYFETNNGREPAYIYLTALSVYLFGRTTLAIRLAAAVIGTLTTWFTYKLAAAWFGKRVGLLSAAVWAIPVWPLHLSRIGLRPVLLPLMLGWPASRRTRAFYSWINDRFVSRVYVETKGATRVQLPGGTKQATEMVLYPDLNDFVAGFAALLADDFPAAPEWTSGFALAAGADADGAARLVDEDTDPPADLGASAGYRRHLARGRRIGLELGLQGAQGHHHHEGEAEPGVGDDVGDEGIIRCQYRVATAVVHVVVLNTNFVTEGYLQLSITGNRTSGRIDRTSPQTATLVRQGHLLDIPPVRFD